MEHEQKLRYEYHTRGRQILQWKQTRQATYVEYRSLIMDCFNVIKFLNKCAKEIKIYITYQTEAGKD